MKDIRFAESKLVPDAAKILLQEAITNEFTGGFHWSNPVVGDPNRIRDHFCRFGGTQTFVYADDDVVGVIYPRRLSSQKDQIITGLEGNTLRQYWRLSNIYIASDHQGCGYGTAILQKFMAMHPKLMYMARSDNLTSQALAEKNGLPHLRDIHILSDGAIVEATKGQRPSVRHVTHRVYMTRP